VSWFRHRGARENLTVGLGWRMAEKGDLFIWPGLLTGAWILTILEMRVEKENLNVTFPGFIVNTCQNCDRRHAGVLAAAAPAAVKLLKLPKIADIETWI